MKMTLTEHGVTVEEGTSSDNKNCDCSICSLEEIKLTWMRETRISLFMLMQNMACRDELDRLIRCYHRAVKNYPEE